jgi:hypothetical protein
MQFASKMFLNTGVKIKTWIALQNQRPGVALQNITFLRCPKGRNKFEKPSENRYLNDTGSPVSCAVNTVVMILYWRCLR